MDTHQVEIGGQTFTFKVTIEKDDDHGAPWENEDGHGPVSDWTTRPKAAGELILNQDRRGGVRYYDFAAACKQALAEGWDHTATKPEGKESKRAQAARAARADFEHLQAWCNDEWQYEFITVVLLDRDGNETNHRDSLGGTDSDYAPEQARLMCDELASSVGASGPTSEELNLEDEDEEDDDPFVQLDKLREQVADLKAELKKAQALPCAPTFSFDGQGLNLVSDEYKSRVFTLAGSYKPGGSKHAEGCAIGDAIARQVCLTF